MPGRHRELEQYWGESQSQAHADGWADEFAGQQRHNPNAWALSFERQHGAGGWASEFEHVSQSVSHTLELYQLTVDFLLLLISGAKSDDVCGSWCSKHSIFGCYGADPYASTHFSSEQQPKVSGIYLSSF